MLDCYLKPTTFGNSLSTRSSTVIKGNIRQIEHKYVGLIKVFFALAKGSISPKSLLNYSVNGDMWQLVVN